MISRMLIGIFTAILVVVAIKTFYDSASSPTDENLFTNMPGHLLCREDYPSVFGEWGSGKGTDSTAVRDFLRRGDLLLTVNGRYISNRNALQAFLDKSPAETTLTLMLRRPSTTLSSVVRMRRCDLADSSFAEIQHGALVISVTPGGASDRAGMKVGDIILRINGKTFTSSSEADVLLRRAQSGRVIAYDVLRALEPLSLPVLLARFGFTLATLVFCLSGIVYIGIGAFIALKRPDLRAARLTGIGLILLGFVIAILFNRRDPGVDAFVAVRWVTMVLALYFGIAMTWHSSQMVPSELHAILSRRWVIRGQYLLAGGITVTTIVLGSTGLITGLWEFLVFAVGTILLLGYGVIVRLAFWGTRDEEARERRRPMLYAKIAVAVLTVGLSVALAALNKSDQYGFSGVFLLFLPVARLYTIGRYRLLGIELRIRRTMQYLMATVVWTIIVVNIAVLLLSLLVATNVPLPAITMHGLSVEIGGEGSLAGTLQGADRLFFVGVGLLLWFAASWGRRKGQRLIDRFFDRTHYDYRRALAGIGSVLATNLSMTTLGRGIAAKLAGIMKLRRAAVFFFTSEGKCCCREAYGIDTAEFGTLCPGREEGLATAIGGSPQHSMIDMLPEPVRQEFAGHGFRCFIPIRSKEKLIAVIVLGEKLSEAPYTDEDHEFLSGVANQASVAIENAFLYEELAEQERMKKELEIARRIQLASLPQKTPTIAGLEVAGQSLPALEVGGDFFDYLLDGSNNLTVVVGDVSGKGTSAALYMAKIQGIFRSLYGFTQSPRELMARANALLCGDMEKSSFVTAVAAAFDSSAKSVRIARAGHLPAYRRHADGKSIEKISPRGIGLALRAGEPFSSELEELQVACQVGDLFVFVSDGITEAQDKNGVEFGEARLLEVLKGSSAVSAADWRDAILAAVERFVGDSPQHDDQTVVVVRVCP